MFTNWLRNAGPERARRVRRLMVLGLCQWEMMAADLKKGRVQSETVQGEGECAAEK